MTKKRKCQACGGPVADPAQVKDLKNGQVWCCIQCSLKTKKKKD